MPLLVPDIIVIGAGAAGMMAAYAAAHEGAGVILYEKNEKPGRKIYITGKGRCNVTNACDFESFIDHEMRNPRFMYASLSRFGQRELEEILSSQGCPLKTERGGRMFPVSDHASDVIRALVSLCEKAGADIRLGFEVLDVRREENEFVLRLKDISDGRIITESCKKVIIATGGLAYPQTGSTGDGYRFAEDLGLRVTPLSPSLTGVVLAEAAECASLAGLSLRNVVLKLVKEGRVYYKSMGELLFTHQGMSGPLILSASSYIAEDMLGRADTGGFVISLDLKPALDEKTLDRRLVRELNSGAKKDIMNVMRTLEPASLAALILRRTGIEMNRKASDITRAERKEILGMLKCLSWHVSRLGGYDEAVVTKGGVDVSQINPATMEVKSVPWLFFAGEVLDIDALTGGFNLQNAFSTGFAAGTAAGRSMKGSLQYRETEICEDFDEKDPE